MLAKVNCNNQLTKVYYALVNFFCYCIFNHLPNNLILNKMNTTQKVKEKREELVKQTGEVAILNTPNSFGFTKDEKAKVITFDELSSSIRVEGKYGKTLQTRPSQSWEVFNDMLEAFDRYNIDINHENIYVQKQNSHIMLTQDEKLLYSKDSAPVSKWLFDSVITSFNVKNDNIDVNPTFAVSFNPNGICYGYGLNVRVCSNMSILNAKDRISTYGSLNNKATYTELMYKVDKDVRMLQESFEMNVETMNRMKKYMFSPDETQEALFSIVGDLYRRAITNAYNPSTDLTAPFNTYELSSFTQKRLSKLNAELDGQDVFGDDNSLWDIYNWGTELMKPGTMDISNIIDNSLYYLDFLKNKYLKN